MGGRLMEFLLDPIRSIVKFQIQHLKIALVKGLFESFDAGLEYTDTIEDGYLWAVIDVESLNTSVTERDIHLMGESFFDAGTYPKMTFKSTQISLREDKELTIQGDLSIKGSINSVVLSGILEETNDSSLREGYTLSLRGEINRTDFGLVFPFNGVSVHLMGETVTLEIVARLCQQ